MGDYVGEMAPHAKNDKNRPGKWVKCEGQMRFIFLFFLIEFLARLWRPHFRIHRHRFCAWWRVSEGIDFLGVWLLRLKFFPS